MLRTFCTTFSITVYSVFGVWCVRFDRAVQISQGDDDVADDDEVVPETAEEAKAAVRECTPEVWLC